MKRNYVRAIDRRNIWYGTYKYQLKIGTFVGSTRDIKEWLGLTFGPERYIDDSQPYWCTRKNEHWTTVKRERYTSPFLYLKGDEELNMFLLRWS